MTNLLNDMALILLKRDNIWAKARCLHNHGKHDINVVPNYILNGLQS